MPACEGARIAVHVALAVQAFHGEAQRVEFFEASSLALRCGGDDEIIMAAVDVMMIVVMVMVMVTETMMAMMQEQ